MKKLVLLVAAVLMGGALVATGGAAVAAYPGTVHTHTLVSAQNTYTHPAGMKAHVSVNVKVTASGNADPGDGTLTLTVRKIKANGTTPIVATKTVNYTAGGANQSVNLGKFGNGDYEVTAKYLPSNNSIYKTSSDTDSFTVSL